MNFADKQYIENLEYENKKLKAARRWITVSERLPETGEWVLCLDGGVTGPFIARQHNGDWFHAYGYLKGVKYWQPLPPLPEEE